MIKNVLRFLETMMKMITGLKELYLGYWMNCLKWNIMMPAREN